MQTALLHMSALLLTLVLIALLSMWYVNSISTSWGSVISGNEYNSQQVTSSTASSTAITQLKSGFGAFGSVVVSSSSPVTSYPPITVYDATSTMATSSAEILAEFGTNNQQHGTYTFDAQFTTGLSVEVPSGFDGVYTVTWR